MKGTVAGLDLAIYGPGHLVPGEAPAGWRVIAFVLVPPVSLFDIVRRLRLEELGDAACCCN